MEAKKRVPGLKQAQLIIYVTIVVLFSSLGFIFFKIFLV